MNPLIVHLLFLSHTTYFPLSSCTGKDRLSLSLSIVISLDAHRLCTQILPFQIKHFTMNDNTTMSNQQLDPQLKRVEQTVLATIFICAVIANILVLLVMLTTRRHRRTTRMAFFICHLTIADLLVAFFSVLPMLIWKSNTTFFGGEFLCRLVPFLMIASTYISVYT